MDLRNALRTDKTEASGRTSTSTLSAAAYTLLLALLLATPFILMSGQLTPAQQVYRLYAYGLLAVMQAVLVALRGWDRSLALAKTPLLLLLLWCALSLVWSQHPELTMRRFALLALVCAGIITGVADLGSRRAMTILRVLLGLALGLNFLAMVVTPDLATQLTEGRRVWCGFMAHKNIAGMLCAATVVVFAFDAGKVLAPVRALVIAGALIFLSVTGSRTAWLCLPLALAAGGAILVLSRRDPARLARHGDALRKGALIAFGALFVILALATVQRDAFLSLTSDTTALTTRVGIWRPMLQFYLDNPILGSGYGAYWDAAPSMAVDRAATPASVWQDVDQGHNGYLDLMVQVGLPGLMLALYAAVVWPLGQLPKLTEYRRDRAALVVALLVFVLLENLSESSLFADDALGNLFLLLALAQLQAVKTRSTVKRRRTPSAASSLLP